MSAAHCTHSSGKFHGPWVNAHDRNLVLIGNYLLFTGTQHIICEVDAPCGHDQKQVGIQFMGKFDGFTCEILFPEAVCIS